MGRAAVVGCGIVGSTTALRLAEEGWRVTIFAREIPPDTTSNRAAAIWEPFQIEPREKVDLWAGVSYHRYRRDADDPASGVFMVELVLVFPGRHPVAPSWLRVEHPSRAMGGTELPEGCGSGLGVQVPFIPSNRYLPWLQGCFRARGGEVRQRFLDSLAEIPPGFDLVVNCSGLGARELVGDTKVRPIRGQLAVVSREEPVRYLIDDTSHPEPVYLFPRGDEVILGGTTEWDREDLREDPATRQRILERCRALEPGLRNSRFLRSEVGLRPGRSEVRLEPDPLTTGPVVIHNYGHGGAGFTVAWGCAEEVVELSRQLLPGAPAIHRR